MRTTTPVLSCDPVFPHHDASTKTRACTRSGVGRLVKITVSGDVKDNEGGRQQASQGEEHGAERFVSMRNRMRTFHESRSERGINRVERPTRRRERATHQAGRDDHDARRKRQAARGSGLRAEGSAGHRVHAIKYVDTFSGAAMDQTKSPTSRLLITSCVENKDDLEEVT